MTHFSLATSPEIKMTQGLQLVHHSTAVSAFLNTSWINQLDVLPSRMQIPVDGFVQKWRDLFLKLTLSLNFLRYWLGLRLKGIHKVSRRFFELSALTMIVYGIIS